MIEPGVYERGDCTITIPKVRVWNSVMASVVVEMFGVTAVLRGTRVPLDPHRLVVNPPTPGHIVADLVDAAERGGP